MGIVKITAQLLMMEGKRCSFQNLSVLQIGRQTIDFSAGELKKWAWEMEYPLNEDCLNELWDDRTFFGALGFRTIKSMDCNDFEGADYIQDLNTDITDSLRNQFDVIYDGGSSEHIFHFIKAWESFSQMLKPYGRIIHSLPSTGWVDHGFFMFSPTALWDYYNLDSRQHVTMPAE